MRKMKAYQLRLAKYFKNDSIRCIMAFAFISIASLSLIWRASRGFDWSDDSYASAIVYRIIQGDSLFSEIWDIHQFSAVILVPIYWIYIKIAGTTGIILFSRYLMTLILCAEAFGIYLRARNNYGHLWSALAAILLLSFGSNFGLTYNTIMVLSFILAFLLIPKAADNPKGYVRYMLSGFVSAIAVQAYPSTIIVLIVFFLYIAKTEKTNRKRALIWYCCGCMITLLLFIAFLSVNSSLGAFFQNVHYLLIDPEHVSNRFSIVNSVYSIAVMIGVPGILIFAAMVASTISRFSKDSKKKLFGNIALISLLAYIVFDGIWMARGFRGSIKYHLYFSIALAFPVIWLVIGTNWDNLIFLWLGGAVASVAVDISTNNGAPFIVYPSLFSAIATLLYIGKTQQHVWRGKHQTKKPQYISSVVLSIMVVFVFVSGLYYVYRDGDLESLDTKMQSGPGAGIYTTSIRAEQYKQTIEAINEYMPERGNVLYTKLLPFGYLCSEARPATPRLWRTDLEYEMFDEYYSNNPQKTPSAIYIVNEAFGITNSDNTIGDFMKRYIDNKPHETIELPCATIIVFGES